MVASSAASAGWLLLDNNVPADAAVTVDMDAAIDFANVLRSTCCTLSTAHNSVVDEETDEDEEETWCLNLNIITLLTGDGEENAATPPPLSLRQRHRGTAFAIPLPRVHRVSRRLVHQEFLILPLSRV